MIAKEYVVLMVDDDPDDVEMLADIFKERKPGVQIVHRKNGKEALAYLEQTPELPCLVLLDMNMPILDGRETLMAIKGEVRFQDIPVVVLTTSTNEVDRSFCKQFTVNVFTKPCSVQDLHKTVDDLIGICNKTISNTV